MNLIPSIPRIPSLQALRAFECAARHCSFSRAADELSLTQGAIGNQVRMLEQDLGVALFERVGRGLALSNEGLALARRLRLALTEIAQATQEVRSKADEGKLVLSVLPSFASRWLVPRVGRFVDQHPDLELVVQASTALADFQRDRVDLCIRFGIGPWEGLWHERLLGDTYYPVCAPHLRREAKLLRPADLRAQRLLRCADEPWTPWFRAAGLDELEEPRGVMYSDAVDLLRAAREGQGIALARDTLVRDDLANGSLVRLFDVSVPSPMSYFLVAPHALAQSRKVQRFRSWLWYEVMASPRMAA